MSIWGSLNLLDCYKDKCEGCEECEGVGLPYSYYGSHILPESTTPRSGAIHCAVLNTFVRHYRDHSEDLNFISDYVPNDDLEPWLRIGICDVNGVDATVIVDKEQVEKMVSLLQSWLDLC